MAAAEEVKLLGTWPSPFVQRARIALNLKKVPFVYLEEVTGMPVKSELLLKSNPVYKKVPVLIHHGNPVCESLIVLQYIDETWVTDSPALLPSDPYDRAIACFWAKYIDDEFLSSMIGTLKAETEEAKSETLQQLRLALQVLEEVFERHCKGKSFFAGDHIGYLDLALGCYLGWLKVVEKMAGVQLLDEEKTPELAAWAARFCMADAVEKVMPEFDKLFEYVEWVVRTFWRVPKPSS